MKPSKETTNPDESANGDSTNGDEKDVLAAFNEEIGALTGDILNQARSAPEGEATAALIDKLKQTYEARFGIDLDADYAEGSEQRPIQEQLVARITAVEKLVEGIRGQARLSREADERFSTQLQTLDMLESGTKTTIEERKAEIADLGWMERQMLYMSGGLAGMEAAITADEAQIARINETRNTLIAEKADLGPGSSKPAEYRMQRMRELFSEGTRVNYAFSNDLLKDSVASLNIADENLRTVAGYVPGGGLGVALADYRMNPNDPEAQQQLLTAAAMTGLDFVPVPGVAAAAKLGGRQALGLALRTGVSKTGRRVAQMVGRKTGELAVKTVAKIPTKAAVEVTAEAIIPENERIG